MIRRLSVVILTLCALCYAQQAMPRYKLTVGRELFYSSVSETQYDKGSSGTSHQWQVWVMSRNPDQSWHLILRRVSNSFRQPQGGEPIKGASDTSWAWCDLFPDGRIVTNSSLADIDPSGLFVPLPADTVSAKQGWQQFNVQSEEGDRYRLLSGDTIPNSRDRRWNSGHVPGPTWQILADHTTSFDAVYEITNHSVVRFDTKQGLVAGRTTQVNQGYGSRKTVSTLTFDSTVSFHPGKFDRFAQELSAYFVTDSTYSALISQIDENHALAPALLARADTLIRQAAGRATDTTVRSLFEQMLQYHTGQVMKQYANSAPDPAETLVGKPAPAWKAADLSGRPDSLKRYLGKVVLLDFWFRGCPWCIRAMPQINQLAQHFEDQPVQVLGMNVDQDSLDAQFVVNKLVLTYPNIHAQGIPASYNVSGYPTLFIIDQQGIIRNVDIGYSADVGAKLTSSVEALLAK